MQFKITKTVNGMPAVQVLSTVYRHFRLETVQTQDVSVPLRWVRTVRTVTGQLADMATRGLPTPGLDISQTGQLSD